MLKTIKDGLKETREYPDQHKETQICRLEDQLLLRCQAS